MASKEIKDFKIVEQLDDFEGQVTFQRAMVAFLRPLQEAWELLFHLSSSSMEPVSQEIKISAIAEQLDEKQVQVAFQQVMVIFLRP